MPTAAIWARVSTTDQRELSLDGQVERVKAKLEGLGYQVPPVCILKVDWTSLDLYSCPQFQELRRWVNAREIQAVGVLDRDRLAAQGLQRLNFLADCKDAGVALVPYQGPPMLEGPEGQLVELALAIGKQRAVERAGQGAKDGLRDRAVLRGLPTSGHKVFGYDWDGPQRLVPNSDWDTLAYICRQGVAGIATRAIVRELNAKSIPSPQEQKWCVPTVWRILTDPTNAGRYYALRREAVEPRKRRAATYGRSSYRQRRFEEWVRLPHVEVVNPPLTWGEWGAIRRRMEQNKLYAQRNAKRDYLLRGIIICDHHRRRYHGQPQHLYWRYTCPVGKGCARPFINGPSIEGELKEILCDLFAKPAMILSAQLFGKGLDGIGARLDQGLVRLEAKANKVVSAATELEARSVRGDVEPEIYERVKARLRAERSWIAEERERLQAQVALLGHQKEAQATLVELQARVKDRLGNADNGLWREIFAALNLTVLVHENGELELAASVPLEAEMEKVDKLVLQSPGDLQRNKGYPLRFRLASGQESNVVGGGCPG